uniref:Uncharacterized protein n=1 Tax=Rhizophora mucronata TaxID=61149 RepID=A0A2P2N3H0_RHIMU
MLEIEASDCVFFFTIFYWVALLVSVPNAFFALLCVLMQVP